MLAMDDVWVRGMAANVIKADSAGLFAQEKAQVMVKSLEGIARVPGTQKMIVYKDFQDAEWEGRPKPEQVYPLRQTAERAIRRMRNLEARGK